MNKPKKLTHILFLVFVSFVGFASCDSNKETFLPLMEEAREVLGIPTETILVTPTPKPKKTQPPFRPIDYAPFLPRGNAILAKRTNKEIDLNKVGTELTTWIWQKKFAKAEQSLLAARKNNVVGSEGRPTYGETLSGLAMNITGDYLKNLDAWCAASPHSMFPLLIRGMAHKAAGWEARGSETADKVAKDKMKIFHDELNKAVLDYYHAGQLDKNDPYPTIFTLQVGMGASWPKEKLRALLLQVMEVDPVNSMAHSYVWSALLPQWYGSMDELFSFSRNAAKAFPDSRLPLLIVFAHEREPREFDKGDLKRIGDHFKKPEVWSEVSGIFETFLKNYPNAIEPHHSYGRFAMLSGRDEIAKRELGLARKRYCERCWWGQDEYDAALTKYGLGPAQ